MRLSWLGVAVVTFAACHKQEPLAPAVWVEVSMFLPKASYRAPYRDQTVKVRLKIPTGYRLRIGEGRDGDDEWKVWDRNSSPEIELWSAREPEGHGDPIDPPCPEIVRTEVRQLTREDRVDGFLVTCEARNEERKLWSFTVRNIIRLGDDAIECTTGFAASQHPGLDSPAHRADLVAICRSMAIVGPVAERPR